MIYLLHLSDLHIAEDSPVDQLKTQLAADLRRELKVNKLNYLVLSGDVTRHSTQQQYDKAYGLLQGLMKQFDLDPKSVVLVPGNHDVNWDLSAEAYKVVHRTKCGANDIQVSKASALACDASYHKKRFSYFADFYRKITDGREYPFEYHDQGILYPYPEDRIVFLGLNSSWAIDHEHTERASIHDNALGQALGVLLEDGCCDDWLKIGVWHHPVTGHEAMNDDFLDQLMQHGFEICMHGHIHEAIKGYRAYDEHRAIRIIGAGTFGSRLTDQPGIPLQYNLLELNPDKPELIVKSRKREKPMGAWSADARWGDKNKPVALYKIKLR